MIYSKLFYEKYPCELAELIARSGCVEALTFDVNGKIITKGVAGISAELDYAFGIWDFYDKESAIERVIISRLQAANLIPEQIGNTRNLDIKATASIEKDLAKQATGDMIKRIDKKFSVNKSLGEEVSVDVSRTPQFAYKIGETISQFGDEILLVMRHGEDVADFFRGRISAKQFLKNTALVVVSAAVTAAAVSTLPIGGGILAFLQVYGIKTKAKETFKSILDGFYEGDDKIMLAILEKVLAEELQGKFLTTYEVELLRSAIADALDKDFIKDMFAEGNDTARASFACKNIEQRMKEVFRQRIFVEMPSAQDWEDGFRRVNERIRNGEDVFAEMNAKREEALKKMTAKLDEYNLKGYEIGHAIETVNSMTKTQLEIKQTFQKMQASNQRYSEIERRQDEDFASLDIEAQKLLRDM